MRNQQLIVGNWKMKLAPDESEQEARSLVRFIKKSEQGLSHLSIVICPSCESIDRCGAILKKNRSSLLLGAQNCSWEKRGAYTGEISASSLQSLGCTKCIIGHSERRTLLLESDALIHKKIMTILSGTAITPILCIGENKKERGAGKVKQVLRRQLRSALLGISVGRPIVIAYEPIWAIGTGTPITPLHCKEAYQFIHSECALLGIAAKYRRVIYGGSVTAENVLHFIKRGISDGALIGAASSELESFKNILTLLSQSSS